MVDYSHSYKYKHKLYRHFNITEVFINSKNSVTNMALLLLNVTAVLKSQVVAFFSENHIVNCTDVVTLLLVSLGVEHSLLSFIFWWLKRADR